MSTTQADPVGEVLNRVRLEPAETRLALIHRVLETLQRDLGTRPAEKRSLKTLLGLLQPAGPTPSDEECERILEEELMRKYGP